MPMKLSVSLPDEDVALLDAYARSFGLPSRSAAVRHAVRLLRHPDLEQDYSMAWDQWAASVEHVLWESTVGDGLVHDAR